MYTPILIKVALGFGHWNTEYNAMLCLSDHQTIAFEDQSTIPKATFIETGIYNTWIFYIHWKWCRNNPEYCTHAGHDYSKNITEMTKK